MIFIRRRLFFWLIKAYLKRWVKIIAVFFIVGLCAFFLILKFGPSILPKVPFSYNKTIGIAGEFTLDSLPEDILSQLSEGMTKVDVDGTVLPDIAKSWTIENGSRKYTFYLRTDVYFNDGSQLSSSDINFNFTDVQVQRPDIHTIVFTLKDQYSPFLVTASRPIFKKGFVGLGAYKIKDIKINGTFVESLTLISVKNPNNTIDYHFYPSQAAVKTAFALGEISQANSLSDITYNHTTFDKFPNVVVQKTTNFHRLITLFYNTKDLVISDDKLRGALSYGIPDSFSHGIRNYSPYPPSLWVYSGTLLEHQQDFSHAHQLITLSQTASKSASITLSMKTLTRYQEDARSIADSWKRLGVNAKIEVVDSIPSTFQIFLGDFIVPNDPDQYTLWHTGQNNNITQYSSLRIDDLLELGRKTSDINIRKKIYADFQKYILADSPASFLYFPYEYSIQKK